MNVFPNRFWTVLVTAIIFSAATLIPGSITCCASVRENDVVRTVKTIGPAVVNISSEYELKERTNPFFDLGVDPFFDSFFRDFFEPRYERKYKGTSLGSGVIVDGKRGYILTNEHVIARSASIKVVLQNELAFEAKLVGAAPDFDLAVLKIESDAPLPDIEMGNSDDIMIGETVIAIGNPFGFSHTVTTGVVSALHRAVQTTDRTYRDFIQTDASINPGNSGGPLVNVNGDLVGITTAIYSKAQGIGFAIPINKAKRVMDDIIKYGEVQLPWLGLFVQDLDPKLTRYFDTPQGQGVLVSKIINGSPAEKAGLRVGDVIIAIGNNRIHSKEAYNAFIKEFTAGQIVPLAVWKSNDRLFRQVHSELFPEALAEEWGYTSLGIKVNDITASLRLRFRIVAKQGVMVTDLRPGSYLESIGARPGDVIRRIDETTLTNVEDFKKAVVKNRHKNSAVLVIQRGNQQYYVTVNLDA